MTLTRPARLTGAALCAALVLTAAVWILKDLAALGSPADLAWYWAGDRFFLARGRAATSLVDPVLLVVSAVAAVAALRSRHAASALAATGAVTLALRLPGLWAPDSGVLVTALLELALAAGLVLVAAAGRRPANAPYEPLPGRPRTVAAVAAGVLLAVAAAAVAGWELYWASRLPAEITVDRFTGGRSVVKAPLGPPPGWLAALLVALYATAAASAFARARHTRAFGLLAGALLAAHGLAGTAGAARSGILERLADLPEPYRSDALTSLFGLLAGVAVLALLAGRGAPAASPAPYPPAGVLPPPPPHPRPPGW
ncbi:hypothetical protein [Streptomyces cinereoruber]|uniref:hypothetical protein n=1 Tax=Streptomyces cinereoruber TaxID=67260 RepID=UPI003C2C514B